MRTTFAAALALGTSLFAMTAAAQSPARLHVQVDHFTSRHMIPTQYAGCVAKAKGHMGFGPDINPRIAWSAGPHGTQSYAILLTDTESPAEHRDWMNKEGKTLTAKVRRHVFFHWVLADIPAGVTSIAEGEVSKGMVPHGRPQTPSPVGLPGLNNYTMVFAANPAMKGDFYGYDGPCPPWNDQIVHPYHFTVYALNVPKLTLAPNFDGPALLTAMHGHVLAQGAVLGLYTTNPAKGATVTGK